MCRKEQNDEREEKRSSYNYDDDFDIDFDNDTFDESQINNIASIFITATISSLTVGGKAIGKKIAIKHSEDIIFMVGKFLNKIRF